ncbi:MAG: thiamine pyrophosphokinase, partial [Pseudomonadota bacterium]|nr:thiamine pyrophosphokinase [Pseudomonadota bacterium]
LCGTHDVVACFRSDARFAATQGDRISIWPLGRQTFHRSSGLRWKLDGLEMQAGGIIGTSNEATAARVEIEAGPGDGYAVIMPVSSADTLLAAMLPAD